MPKKQSITLSLTTDTVATLQKCRASGLSMSAVVDRAIALLISRDDIFKKFTQQPNRGKQE